MSRKSQKRKRRMRQAMGEGFGQGLTLDDALRVIRDSGQSALAHVAAAYEIAKNSKLDPSRVSSLDLFECIRRGHIAAEIGADVLGRRLGVEPGPSEISDETYWVRAIESIDPARNEPGALDSEEDPARESDLSEPLVRDAASCTPMIYTLLFLAVNSMFEKRGLAVVVG